MEQFRELDRLSAPDIAVMRCQLYIPEAVGLYEPGVQRWGLGCRPQFGSHQHRDGA